MQLQIFPRPLPYVLITVMDEICLVASTATNLFLVHLERVAVLHFERFWRVRGLHTSAVEQESDSSRNLALTIAEGVHQLLQLCSPLDLEEDLIVAVGNLDVQVL